MKPHPLDPFSILFGLLFTIAGLLYVSGERDIGSLPSPGWLLPVGLIVIGVAIIGSVARQRERAHEPRPDEFEDKH